MKSSALAVMNAPVVRLMAMMMNLLRTGARTLAAVAALAPACSVAATGQVCSAASGAQRTAVLELYTSEGCSSCPPADKWVSELPARKLDTPRLIPLAFHVDYWNYIGWTDPYAQSRFSDRQREHAKRRNAGFVYTPQLLLNGQDYRRGMLFDDIDSRVRAINQSKPYADITLTVTGDNGTLAGTVVAAARSGQPPGAQLYVALTENKLATAVKAGENKGRTLQHDFVVRDLAGPVMLDSAGRARDQHTFKLDPSWKTRDLAIVAFVQHPQSGEVWQALSVACP